MRQAHVIIDGVVQGVGYRAWTADLAREKRLAGWVRNRRNSSVEAVFVGEDGLVESMIAACRRGPAMARVSGVSVTPWTGDVPVHFEVLSTL